MNINGDNYRTADCCRSCIHSYEHDVVDEPFLLLCRPKGEISVDYSAICDMFYRNERVFGDGK